MADPFTIGAGHLNDFQLAVFDECLDKGSGGLSLPMGSGKTLLSLLIGLHQSNDDELLLVVCSKSLLASWEIEIKQFFGRTLKYEILHREYSELEDWRPKKGTKVVIVNSDTIARAYTTHEVSNKFIFREPMERNPALFINHYYRVKKPFLPGRRGIGYLFSICWGCFIVDEVQDYTNIKTNKCQALGAVFSKHRWLLSGTIFNEPKPERLLGYHIILDYRDFPRNLPEAKQLMYSGRFRGLRRTVVHRDKNEAFIPPRVNETIISHKLSEEEVKIYTMMKSVLIELKKHLAVLKERGAPGDDIKRFSSYLLAMITYLREGLICPIIPLSSVAIDMADFHSKNELSEILTNRLEQLELNEWLDDPRSVRSTRIRELIKTIAIHPNEQIVVFSCYRSALDILRLYLPRKRKNYTLSGNMTGKKRGQVIEEFRASKRGILLLTYDIGSQGLNLQSANTAMLLDYWWNAGKTNQAIARILRFGQRADKVNVYFFTSNTGVENAILEKQRTKLLAIEELQHGHQTTEVYKMKVDDIINIIELESNETLLLNIYKK